MAGLPSRRHGSIGREEDEGKEREWLGPRVRVQMGLGNGWVGVGGWPGLGFSLLLSSQNREEKKKKRKEAKERIREGIWEWVYFSGLAKMCSFQENWSGQDSNV